MTFSQKLDGDTKPPYEQNNLSDEERKDKEKAAFDEALWRLSRYWEGATFNGFGVVSTKILCGDDEIKWNDQDAIKEYLKAPVMDLHKYSELSNESKSISTIWTAISMRLFSYGVRTLLAVLNGDLVVSKNHFLKLNTVFQHPICPNNTKVITRPIFSL